MTPEQIAADVAREAVAMDQRFDQHQPALIAAWRQHGVTEAEVPARLAEAHALYWQTRCALLARLEVLLARLPR